MLIRLAEPRPGEPRRLLLHHKGRLLEAIALDPDPTVFVAPPLAARVEA